MVVSELFLLFAILLNKRLILTYDEETSSANQHSTKKAWSGGLETHHSAAKLQYSFGMSKKKGSFPLYDMPFHAFVGA